MFDLKYSLGFLIENLTPACAAKLIKVQFLGNFNFEIFLKSEMSSL